MTDTEKAATPGDNTQQIDPGGSAGSAGAGLGAPADTSGYDDAAPLQNPENTRPAPVEEENSASPAEGPD